MQILSEGVLSAGSSAKRLTNTFRNTQKILQSPPSDRSEEGVHGRCVGEAEEGLGGLLDAGCEEDAVGGPADGVGDGLFGKLGVEVPQVAGPTLQQEGKTAFTLDTGLASPYLGFKFWCSSL